MEPHSKRQKMDRPRLSLRFCKGCNTYCTVEECLLLVSECKLHKKCQYCGFAAENSTEPCSIQFEFVDKLFAIETYAASHE